MKKTLILSTTNGWNPGDDFIREGILNLLERNFNLIFYNRAPNVLKEKMNNINLVLDICNEFVCCGTPEWITNHEEVFEKCIEKSIKISFIGVSGNDAEEEGDEILKKLNERNLIKLAIARDTNAFEKFKRNNIEAKLYPCPALFFNEFKYRDRIKTVGIGFMTFNEKYDTQFKTDDFERRNDLIKRTIELTNNFQTIIITHYLGDYIETKNLFKDNEIFFSTDFRDYRKIYDEIDLYIGFRLHGTIVALGSGAPSFLLGIDHRMVGIDQFSDLGNIVEYIDSNIHDNDSLIQKIKEWKENQESSFQDRNKKIYDFKVNIKEKFKNELKVLLN